jgi:hypothetical protein
MGGAQICRMLQVRPPSFRRRLWSIGRPLDLRQLRAAIGLSKRRIASMARPGARAKPPGCDTHRPRYAVEITAISTGTRGALRICAFRPGLRATKALASRAKTDRGA